ncbi:hypothetical protein FE839_09170 [Klebsiella indica]|uniref:PaaX family transcriptional regulator n=1 Tax=Klebsiella indica TaxID=2582917 RepID=A0A5R9LK50_9ENTR|nr:MULTISPECIES: PaaX family transcriptional regulator C-terminal domain-containing protein [Klebsiella]TLV19968.1 hypothetical protein FE839_09170 [Klebsiella indica]
MTTITTSISGSTQSLILGLLGLYLLEQPAPIFLPTRFFLDALSPAKLPEITVRMTLTRMVERGLLNRVKHGRTAHYSLTDMCRMQLTQGRDRIFSTTPFGCGEDIWTFLFFMDASYKETSRYQFHTRLDWAGFSKIDPRLWLAPGRIDAVRLLTDILPVEILDDIQFFHGKAPDAGRFFALVRQTWDIESIRAAHLDFQTRWDKAPQQSDTALFRLIELVNDWTLLLRNDPGLPAYPTGPDRDSDRSRIIFWQCYSLLRPVADRQFAALASECRVESVISTPGQHDG